MDHLAPPADLPAPSRLPVEPEMPDPLVTIDGDDVETPDEWYDRRRPEIRRLFEHYVYGYTPDRPSIETEHRQTVPVLDGRATLTEVTLQFSNLPTDAPTIELALFMPAHTESAPVFLALNHNGNHSMIDDEAVTIGESSERFGIDERGSKRDFWCVDRLVERGYGFATFHQADVDPDRDTFTDGIHPYYTDLSGRPEAQWGTLAAWAWGLQCGVDALLAESAIRTDGIALIGHSRRGKAALLAGALDERVDLVVPHQSGTGGCAPSRGNDQETVAAINETFPHWFNDVFPAFSGRADRLPVDQHLLLALVAPRPLLDTEGTRDSWANPGRAYDALRAADPVYDLLDATGTSGSGLLHESDEITDETAGDLLQYRQEAGHTLGRRFWEAILDFADLHV